MNNEYIKDYRTDTYIAMLNLNSMELEKHNVNIDILDKDICKTDSFKFEQENVGLIFYMSKIIIEDDIHGSSKVENTNSGALFTIELGLNYE